MFSNIARSVLKAAVTDATSAEVKAAVSPLMKEAAKDLSSPGTSAIAPRATLSLKEFPPADSILAPDSATRPPGNKLSTPEKIKVPTPGSRGRETSVVEVERKASRFADKTPRPPAKANDFS